jgi:hypothetical protein
VLEDPVSCDRLLVKVLAFYKGPRSDRAWWNDLLKASRNFSVVQDLKLPRHGAFDLPQDLMLVPDLERFHLGRWIESYEISAATGVLFLAGRCRTQRDDQQRRSEDLHYGLLVPTGLGKSSARQAATVSLIVIWQLCLMSL